MARALATARSDGRRSPSARAPRSMAAATARASVRNIGPGVSDHGPSAPTRSATAPLRREVALFCMSQSREGGDVEQAAVHADQGAPFGTVFVDQMTVARWADGA